MDNEIKSRMEKFSKQELIRIIKCYNEYLQDWFDDDTREEGQEPVCIYEFINNEYQEMIISGFTDYFEYLDDLLY